MNAALNYKLLFSMRAFCEVSFGLYVANKSFKRAIMMVKSELTGAGLGSRPTKVFLLRANHQASVCPWH